MGMFGGGDQPAQLAKKLRAELEAAAPSNIWGFDEIAELAPTKEILAAAPEIQIQIIMQTIQAVRKFREKAARSKGNTLHKFMNLKGDEDYPRASAEIVRRLLRKDLPFTERDVLAMLDGTIGAGLLTTWSFPYLEMLVARVESFIARHGATPAWVMTRRGPTAVRKAVTATTGRVTPLAS